MRQIILAKNQKDKQTASDGAASDLFGISVSIYDNYAIVGAYGDDVGGKTNQGQAYIYHSIDNLSLPVELSAFTAIASGDNVILKWRTESEVNNIGFAIYRSERTAGEDASSSGKYTKIAFVSGAGNSAMPTDYKFSSRIPSTQIPGFLMS